MYLVPADGSGPAAPVGSPYRGQESHFYGFSPDGTTVFLDQTGKTTLIDLASGETTDLSGDRPWAGGWQRLRQAGLPMCPHRSAIVYTWLKSGSVN